MIVAMENHTHSKISPWRSLGTRATVFTLAVFVIGIWALAFYATRLLQHDLQRQLSEQQFSTASFVAEKVNEHLVERLAALENVAHIVEPGSLGNAHALQVFLTQRPTLQGLFNAGTYITDVNGTAQASLPVSVGRVGVNYMEFEHLAAALKDGKSSISKPRIGKALPAPVVGMAVPIRDGQGKMAGALVGVVDLSKPNFLDSLSNLHYGETGGYVLVSAPHRLVITATDKSRIMEQLPAAGVNPWVDRFVQGYEGSAIATNPKGVEVLVSGKGIPAAHWYALATLPTSEAFAPIREMRQRMVLATLALTLLAGVLTWWMIQRELSPLRAAAKALADVPTAGQLKEPLHVVRQDEVGALVAGFNRLLATNQEREASLRESEAFKNTVLNSLDAEIAVLDPNGVILAVNDRWQKFALDNGLEPGQAAPNTGVGTNYFAVCGPGTGVCEGEALDASTGLRAVLEGRLPSFSLDYPCDSPTQARWFGMTVMPLGQGAISGAVVTHTNITIQKQSEEALRIAATAFESQQGMLITDAQRVILRVNQAFTQITGYSAEEAIGKNPRILKSDRHDSGFYEVMTQALDHEGNWAGEIWNRRKNGEVYPEWLNISAVKDNSGLTTHFVAIFSDITERVEAQSQIYTLAFYDPLTQLPNRRLMLDRLEQALHASTRHSRKNALLFIDLDNFRTLNDTLGHHLGDLLLAQVAQRLKSCMREGDTVARLGSDEFVVLLENLSEDELEAATQAETVAASAFAVFQQDFQLDGLAHHCTPSIGISLFGGKVLESSDQPLKRAELAMFQAKAAGRNTLRFFDKRMQAEVSAHAALEADLREAVNKQQFLLYYQPQMVGSDRMTGMEALVRWQHPQRGMVSPAEFIPMAEECGLILPIGQWVLETACAQLAVWATDPEMAHLTIAVNVSARQFRQSDFVGKVLATLARTRAKPDRLKLELTESMLVDDVDAVITKMGTLKIHGVKFSLDDFGTGYSSLAYLKRLPLDQLKIDQGFVRNIVSDPNDAAIARMVVALAESMGLSVIAEGVELQAQADFLAHLGCHAYQGYLFGRPLPLQQLEAFELQPA
jgi:diguanylate cyclase (GGDEF)-like protein/PAS domain S-box-containing protein